MTPTAISVLVVDDQSMLAEGVAAYLRHAEDIDFVGVALNGKDALVAMGDRTFDVILLDFRLPDTSGDELAVEMLLMSPATKILMITANDDDDIVTRAITAGCQGFLPKGRTAAELLEALRAIHAGEMVFDAAVLARALHRATRSGHHELGDDLTAREREMLQLLATGLTTTAIARQLSLSQATVRNHTQNVLSKLGAHSQLEAVMLAVRHGLVEAR